MKKLLFLFGPLLFFCHGSYAQGGHTINYFHPIPYTKQNPTTAPKVSQSKFLYNTETGVLWQYRNGAWTKHNEQSYASMVISNDTLSISYAGTTADTLEGMTSGGLSDFTLDADGGTLTYTGALTKTFKVNYSTSFTFAEASVVFAYMVKNGTIVYPTRTRNLPATAGNMVNSAGQGIITLSTGNTVGLFFVPGTHTGTDVLTVYEANVILEELK